MYCTSLGTDGLLGDACGRADRIELLCMTALRDSSADFSGTSKTVNCACTFFTVSVSDFNHARSSGRVSRSDI